MKKKYLANGETYISVKIENFNKNFEQFLKEVEEAKIMKGNDLSKKQKSRFNSKRRKLKELLNEIDVDNKVYFFGFLKGEVEALEAKLNSIRY